ncbi:phosphoribosylanthranilate isomerase [Enterococcus wangshanyuanii]|uniref:N-(5'-phosphoribosyl)anthranilate isomerase n=1 Tax=Enterococcus wangshanyuanii TaxID=2005703 RepID=A0ABQ1P695_9ENTE|nr:phosphoribosylanthranilate isomerase [Enterococcus wangshanyuanii]GGC91928.1 N-(5'-phosphoribosyl)anthranilate isomerase [Enterococcus wangshanyuanii]
MKVKICGLKTKKQVDTAVKNGADYLGFVFAESKRKISPDEVREITKDVPETVKKVGVMVAPKYEEAERIIQQAKLDMLQIHGMVATDQYSVPIIQAISVDGDEQIKRIQAATTDYLLFDAPPQEFVGGNGQVFDWEKLALDQLTDKKIVIAGGLTIENVQEAKRMFSPYAVDVSSGVETDGIKDLKKISAFLKKAKEENNV